MTQPMTTGLVYDERFLEHDTEPGHPERPDRLRAIHRHLKAAGLMDQLTRIDAKPVDLKWVLRVHEEDYVARLHAACDAGEPYIDTPDSAICPASYEVALLAAGGVLAAVDAVMSGVVANAFCAVRPPGHHAERDRSMGFCLLNNIAIAAEYLIGHHGLDRVAIVDFDVHHGNGTQHIFERRRDVLFISLHEHPRFLYPGTGFSQERGRDEGEGYTINIPMMPRSGDANYREAFDGIVLPALERFEPQALLISAGFDAAAGDPLAHIELTPEGFKWMTKQLRGIAESHANGRIVSLLEGGYNLETLCSCLEAHLRVLMSV